MESLVDVDANTFLGEGDGCLTAPYTPPGTPDRTGVELCGTAEAQVQTPSTKYYTVEAVYQGRSIALDVKNGTRENAELGFNMLSALKAHGTGTMTIGGQVYPAGEVDVRIYENGQLIHTTEQQKAAPAPVAPAPAPRPAVAPPAKNPLLTDMGIALVAGGLSLVALTVYMAYKGAR